MSPPGENEGAEALIAAWLAKRRAVRERLFGRPRSAVVFGPATRRDRRSVERLRGLVAEGDDESLRRAINAGARPDAAETEPNKPARQGRPNPESVGACRGSEGRGVR